MAMAEGFVQAGLNKPRSPGPHKNEAGWITLVFSYKEPPVHQFGLAQQVFLETEEASSRSGPEDSLQVLKGVKALSWPEMPDQRQIQRRERQEWEGPQDLTRCLGPWLDLWGSRHGAH